jgi:hypothetical protein
MKPAGRVRIRSMARYRATEVRTRVYARVGGLERQCLDRDWETAGRLPSRSRAPRCPTWRESPIPGLNRLSFNTSPAKIWGQGGGGRTWLD